MSTVCLKDLWGRRLSEDVEQKFSAVTAEISAVRADEKQRRRKPNQVDPTVEANND